MAARGARAAARPDAAYRRAPGRSRDDPEGQRNIEVFQNGFRDLGWIEGRNIHIDYRWSPGADTSRIRAIAADLIESNSNLILASATEGLAAFSNATKTIPIVFVAVSDPVGQGFVSNLARPGGNITGFTAFEFSMGGKWIEILKQIAPTLSRAGLYWSGCLGSRRRCMT
jgi:putative tryptophan/tyrosine transport system substrate-binding protein